MDPRLAVILNLVYQILTGITTTTLSTFGIADATHVLAICEALAGFVNIILHAYSPPTAGPLAKVTPPSTGVSK